MAVEATAAGEAAATPLVEIFSCNVCFAHRSHQLILSAHARRSTVQSRREYHNKAERERTKQINGLIQVRHSVVIGPPSLYQLM